MIIKKSTWSQTSNVFENVTRYSYKKMDLLATDHHDKLLNNTADAAIQDLYNTVFIAPFTDFKTAYTAVLTTEARYSNKTMQAEMLWKALSENISEWAFLVESVGGTDFRRNTINYKLLFAQGFAPFQNGAYEQRMRALTSFIVLLNDFTALDTVTATVTAFHQQLLAARSDQQGFENELAKARTLVDATRTELADTMQRVFGYLLYKYAPNTAAIDDFYDLTLLKASTKTNSDGSSAVIPSFEILPAMQRTILSDTYDQTTVFKLLNIGDAEVKIWLTNNPNSIIPPTAIVLAPSEGVTVSGLTLSDGSTDLKHLVAFNMDNLTKARIEAETED
jgi:hypothetical protein